MLSISFMEFMRILNEIKHRSTPIIAWDKLGVQ